MVDFRGVGLGGVDRNCPLWTNPPTKQPDNDLKVPADPLSGIPVTNLHSPFVLERRRLDAITGQQSQAPVAERVTLRSRLQKSGGSHGLFQINFQSL